MCHTALPHPHGLDVPELPEPCFGDRAATLASGHIFQLLQGREGARGAWEEGGALQDPAECGFGDDRQAREP